MAWHPRSRFPQVANTRAHCVDAGSGPPVLLLHGYMHSSWTWRGTVDALAPDHRVLVPDLPGHGWGEAEAGDPSLDGLADWVSRILDRLGVGRLRLAVGHSLGGAALLALALREPQRFEHLLLVAPMAGPFRLPGALVRSLGARALSPLFRATAGNARFIRRALRFTAYKRRRVDEEILHGFTHLRRPEAHRVAVELARSFGDDTRDLAARSPQLQVPASLVWGARDGVLPLRYGRGVERRLGTPLNVFEDCGHCPHEEHPERFHAFTRRLLDGGAP